MVFHMFLDAQKQKIEPTRIPSPIFGRKNTSSNLQVFQVRANSSKEDT